MRIFGGTNFVCITCGNNGRHYLSVGIRVLTTMKVFAIKVSNLHLYALYATSCVIIANHHRDLCVIFIIT